MKWINAVLVFLLLSPAILGDELLILTSPKDGELDKERTNCKIVWSGSDKYLESWKLSYNLSFSTDNSGALFYSYGLYDYDNVVYLSNNKHKGISFGITEKGNLYFHHNEEKIDLVNFALKPNNSTYTLSVSFITTYNLDENKNILGNFYLALNDQTFSYEITDASNLRYCYLSNETTYPGLFTNKACDYSNIELYKLDNRIIPEPSSVVLLSVSLLELMRRRRRR